MNENSDGFGQSGFGIAAFIVALIALVIIFFGFAIAGYISAAHVATSATNTLVGLVIFFGWLLELIALVLGIIGLRDKKTKRVMPLLGIWFSAVPLSLSVIIIIIGILNNHGA